MTPDQALAEAQKSELRPVYLLVGDEAYLEAQVLSALKRAATQGGIPGLNDEILSAGDTPVDRVLAAARTLPMMAKRRFVMVRGLERWEPREGVERKGTDPFERLLEYAKDPTPSTVLVLAGGGLDKRRRFVTQAKQLGFLVSCDTLERSALPSWILRGVKERGARMAPDVADLVAELAGPELAPVADAVERLCLYVGSGEITEDAVAECVVRLRPSTVWELVGAVGRRDVGAALAALHRVYDPADRGLRLVGVLAWSTRQLIRFESALRSGLKPGEAAAKAGAPPFKARELAEQVKALDRADLDRFLLRLTELDLSLKGGSKRTPIASLTYGVLELCRAGGGQKAAL